MEKKKLFIFDIDGTVLGNDKAIPESTKAAIRELSKKHEVAIATGRNRAMAIDIIKELNISNYIVWDGAAAFYHGDPIVTNNLDEKEVELMVSLADKNKHHIIFETVDDMKRRNDEPSEGMAEALKAVDHPVPSQDKDFFENQSLVQILLFYTEEEAHLYEENQFEHFRFVRWHENAVDVLPVDGSKFNTIERLAKHMDFDMEDIIAFGDGLNDLEMIKHVGIGVAMGNARDEVKEAADIVTDSNMDDGILNALRLLGYAE